MIVGPISMASIGMGLCARFQLSVPIGNVDINFALRHYDVYVPLSTATFWYPTRMGWWFLRNEGYDDGIDHPSCNLALLPLSTVNPRLSDFARFSEMQSVIQGLCFGCGCVIELTRLVLGYRTRTSTSPSLFVHTSLVKGDFTIYGVGLGGWPRLLRYKGGVDDMGPTTPIPADGGNLFYYLQQARRLSMV